MSDETPTEVTPDSTRMIALVGEISFSGKAVARALSAHGLAVRVLCPDAQAEAALAPVQAAAPGEVELLRGDLSSAQALSDVLEGAYAVCFLSPVSLGGRLYRPHTHLADVRQVIQAADQQRLRKIVYHSSLGAHQKAASRALRDAAAAEQLIADSHCEDFRLRTGPLMGRGDDFLSEMAGAARSSGWCMRVLGYGSTLVQPLHVDDLARCLTRILADTGDEFKPGVYNLGGPETVTLLELLDSFLELTQRHKLKIHVPLFVLKLLASARRDAAFRERVSLLFDNFNSDLNDTPSLLGPGTTLVTPRQAQQEVLELADCRVPMAH